jgi:hypothetical protein
MLTEARTRPCSGNCGQNIPANLPACRDDWERLPPGLRRRYYTAWRSRHHSPAPYRAVVNEAWVWFRDNPPASPATDAVHVSLNRPSR